MLPNTQWSVMSAFCAVFGRLWLADMNGWVVRQSSMVSFAARVSEGSYFMAEDLV